MISLVDAHCDTITEIFDKNGDFYDNAFQLSIKKLSAYETPVQFFAFYLSEKYLNSPFKNTLKMIDFYYDQVNKYFDYIDTVSYASDILNNKVDKKISGIITLEGGEPLEGKISNLETFFELGIRCMTLTHNKKNLLGDGVGVTDGEGLTDFGRQVVRKMGNLNMIVDVSHLNEKGFWDVAEISKKPFIASHSNSYSVCPHMRNLNDEQLRAIKDCGGMVGLNLYSPFVSEQRPAINDLIKHIDYIIKLIGEDNIGLGCDFDGMDNDSVEGLENVSDLIKLHYEIRLAYGQKIANKIFSENFLNFLSKNLPENISTF